MFTTIIGTSFLLSSKVCEHLKNGVEDLLENVPDTKSLSFLDEESVFKSTIPEVALSWREYTILRVSPIYVDNQVRIFLSIF